MDERVATNRQRWDEMSDLHIDTSSIDDVDAAGIHTLKAFEPRELRGLREVIAASAGACIDVRVDSAVSPRGVDLADRVTFVCATVDAGERRRIRVRHGVHVVGRALLGPRS